MKKLVVFIIAFILTACLPSTPQVTLTPEATVTSTPPPTETPIPTPTSHPQFTALQNEIVDSSTRFTLQADGLIYDGQTPIPGISVAPDGVMTISVNGETVTLDPDSVSFGEDGVEVEGYELNDEGEWVEAISKSMQQTNKLIETYGLEQQIAEGKITVTEEGGAVNVVDVETGKVLIRTIGENSKYDLGFAVDTVAASSCEPTDFKSSSSGGLLSEFSLGFGEYRNILLQEVNFENRVGQKIYTLLVNPSCYLGE
jgi:hypothetical protein